ncbi:MAG: PIN domain-containing protein [Beijerinckiaceae bacterium]|nr:PIN domain-containing protein [Beijerinckiaceae bacterium]
MIHLDTNAALAALNGRPVSVRTRFDDMRGTGASFAMSIAVYCELIYGAAASERRRENEEKVTLFIASGGISLLPVEEEDAREAASIRARLKRWGTPIGPYDVFIAAQALRQGATLVTANAREYERVPGLTVTDWAA